MFLKNIITRRNYKQLSAGSVNMTILCSCDIADSSFNHSSSITAHSAKSRWRSLLVVTPLPVELLDNEPITVDDDECVESNDVGSDDGLVSRRGMLMCEAAPIEWTWKRYRILQIVYNDIFGGPIYRIITA